MRVDGLAESIAAILNTSGKPWECGGGWNRFVENDIEASVKLLKGAADNEIWPIAPWYTLLSLFGRTGEENAVSGMEHEVAVLLVNMPSKELAELDLQLARWLEGTWQKLGKKQRRELWGRIWSALLNKAPQGDLDYDMTLNYAGGILGSILYKEMVGCIPNVSAGENPGIPSWLRPDFEKIATEDPSAKLARVRIAPMLVTLYRIDPDWTNRAFFSRMNPDDKAAFDPHLWEGYFWSARWPTDLLRSARRGKILIAISA